MLTVCRGDGGFHIVRAWLSRICSEVLLIFLKIQDARAVYFMRIRSNDCSLDSNQLSRVG